MWIFFPEKVRSMANYNSRRRLPSIIPAKNSKGTNYIAVIRPDFFCFLVTLFSCLYSIVLAIQLSQFRIYILFAVKFRYSVVSAIQLLRPDLRRSHRIGYRRNLWLYRHYLRLIGSHIGEEPAYFRGHREKVHSGRACLEGSKRL